MTMTALESVDAKKKNMNSSKSSRRLSGDILEMIKEEEEGDQTEGGVGGGDQLEGIMPTAKTKISLSTKITTPAVGKKRHWGSGLKKVRNMVVNPINVLEAKYVQFMTGFACRVGTRTSPTLSSPRAVPIWQL